MGPLVTLAYSGGLDTSVIVPWLKETRGARVLCYVADVGQGAQELRGIEEKALQSGAVGCSVDDLRAWFISDFVFPTLRAGAVYARTYLLGTAMARPAIAAGQVQAARAAGASLLAHGCTGKGNDQVRFELTFQALAPELGIVAPWREWTFRGREALLAYLRQRGIPVDATSEKLFSRDRNLWHCSHEGGILEDPEVAPPDDLFLRTVDPADAPDAPADITIGFETGTPVSLDGQDLAPVAMIEALNDLAGRHGVGRADVVEDRLVGMKSRGVYETPAGTVLRAAHRDLEQLVLDRRTLALKDSLAARYADLVYEGRWWTTEREALDALVDVTQRRVTGTVRVRLFKGAAAVLSRASAHSLYSAAHATFEADDVYRQADASGFITLFGLPVRIDAQAAGRAKGPNLREVA
ncbi:MAG: argininosuccinate synthase [Gemmatimonadota bacterium]|nr:argininosuccinate synthase [Gemmatimonadota bacterium]MDH3367332.1 argininosuccinate synthase [Gemmatimonadota bacterium]MDH3478484.1 argininosuccinate synthase [Gemmatimonadota bacterium]MDH3569730.1 argininosuccinate synthase [Gemmatimonadota bacterium]MDH5548882.1 argininosuccinate synthase [Gemmatimonadota bacterium]